MRYKNPYKRKLHIAAALSGAAILSLQGCGTYTVIGDTGLAASAEDQGELQTEAECTDGTCPDTTEGEILSQSPEEFKAFEKGEPEFESRDETVYVQKDEVNVRSGPVIITGESSNVVFTANTGDEFRRTGYRDDFSRVVKDDLVFYISSDYLSVNKPEMPETEAEAESSSYEDGAKIGLDSSWKYADFSAINSGKAVLYKAQSDRKGITVAVNAGHGTSGGSSVKTWCHPDKTPKVTGGTTSAGSTKAVAVSTGMNFNDGTPEAKVTLKAAKMLKDKLLPKGYDVLMLRDGDDVQLDNVARTVIANNAADCHIAIHWDGDGLSSDKGCFYMSTPDGLKSMEPVASNWQKHHALGDSLISGLKESGAKIWGSNPLPMDLTQTSFSTVASVDIELGNQASDHSDSTLDRLTEGLSRGVDIYFGQ